MTGQEKIIDDLLMSLIEKQLSPGDSFTDSIEDYLKFRKALALKAISENLKVDAVLSSENILSTINGN